MSRAKRKRNQAAEIDHQLKEAYRKLLLLPEGRLVLRTLLSECGVLAPSCGLSGNTFTSGSETFWREGRRSIGLWLIGRLNEISAHAYAALTQESANEIEAERLQADRLHSDRATQQHGPSEEEDV